MNIQFDISTIKLNHVFGVDVRYKIINNCVKNILGLTFDDNMFSFCGKNMTTKCYYQFMKQIINKNFIDFNELITDLNSFLLTYSDN
jgi:hypothetical protein